MTPLRSVSNFVTCGGSASRGSSLPMMATRLRTSSRASLTLRLRSNWTMTNELPTPEMERSSVMPSTVLTCSSMGWEMSDSTSTGDAPGSRVPT